MTMEITFRIISTILCWNGVSVWNANLERRVCEVPWLLFLWTQCNGECLSYISNAV